MDLHTPDLARAMRAVERATELLRVRSERLRGLLDAETEADYKKSRPPRDRSPNLTNCPR